MPEVIYVDCQQNIGNGAGGIPHGTDMKGGGRQGFAAIFSAYVLWGILPVYWRAMSSLDPLEVLAHRAIWSCAFTFLLLVLSRRADGVMSLLRSGRRTLLSLAASGAVITVNWYLYIWAVNSGRILETSLGYFINPLVSILFGMVFFKERLRRAQWAAIALAICGVLAEVAYLGRFPLVSLGLAFTFGLYGLLKKLTAVDPITGMMAETALMTPFALAWLVWRNSKGLLGFPYSVSMTVLLMGAGVLTAIPLIVFAWGVSRVSMTLLGLAQYTSPIMTFLTATLVYHEPMPAARVVSFALIWAAIAIFTAESFVASGQARAAGVCRNG
ncbi:MAG: EamA family transporter RarD [Synergistaceae bacterium]|jgi:chloramphenicol-sensitive protein RarD|nr:EamA family transporter RarD [Synergistaceae bacterium]